MRQNPTVAVFGEVLADIFPDQSVLGGAPLNVARHLQAFGLQPLLISRIGQDALGERLLAATRAYSMDVSGIQQDNIHPTGQVQVVMTDDGHRFEICDEQAYDYIDTQAANSALQCQAQLMYFGTLAQRHAVSRQTLYALLENNSGLRFLDINLRPPWIEQATIAQALANADIVKMNDDELATITHMLQLPGHDAQAHAMALLQTYRLQAVVITAGEQGAWQLSQDGTILRASAQPSEDMAIATIIDTVGAGDAFSAVYILGLLSLWPAEKILTRANQFAAALCGVRGGVPADSFYLPFLQQWQLGQFAPQP